MRSSPNKRGARLGQHFLTSTAIAEAIVDAAHITPNETVLEVGPGKGILTEALLAQGARVVAVEKDPALVVFLNETFLNEIREKRLEIREGDVRDLKLSSLNSHLSTHYKVVANIPYYITGELMRMFLTAEHQPNTIVFLVQKEVAERVAKSKKESLLSLSVKAYGTPRYVKTVKAGSFSPPPSVDSAILAIENISREHFKNTSEENFFKLLHVGFGQKRKTLMGNLKRAGLYTEAMALDPTTRAEDVPPEAWLTLSKALERP